MKKVLLVLVLLACGVTWALLPPAARTLPADPGAPPFVRGVVHVHTNRSDGTGSQDSIAAAAARAGLQFVVFTDHGDAAQDAVPPTYLHGVLCVDAVEISTDNGHVVAIGLPRAPYPLGGRARDVIEDIHRLGGMAIAAHPSSPRESLRWSDPEALFDGIEWLNGDSQWRDERLPTLARTLLTYWLRPAESLGQLLDRPADAMTMWDEASRTRRVVGLAAADAHARIGMRGVGEPYDDRPVGRLPGYESQFRAFSIAVPGRLSGTAATDAAFVLDAIEQGRVVSVVDALASPGWLEFTATSGQARAEHGGELRPADGAREISLHVRAPVVTGARVSVIRDGREVGTDSLDKPVRMDFGPEPATFRVEVTLPGSPGMPPVPWLVSNPIYVRAAPAPARAVPPTLRSTTPTTAVPRPREMELAVTGTAAQWTVEHTPRADGRVGEARSLDGTQLLARWALGGTEDEPASVAIARSITLAAADYDALVLRANASRPMRVSVQLRAPNGTPAGRRWARSIYLDETAREMRLALRDFVPVGHAQPIGDGTNFDSLLFVIDHVNAALGSSGMFWLDDVRFVAPQVRTESRR